MTRENTSQTLSPTGNSAIIIAEDWLRSFSEALDSRDAQQVAAVFEPDGFWRDFVSLTWNLYTAEGHEQIEELVTETLDHVSPRN